MKKILLLCLLLVSINSFSQDDVSKKIQLSLVDSVTGNKKELINYAKAWIAKSFQSARAVIEMEDLENGKLIGKVIIPLDKEDARIKTSAHFTITIDAKDNKYRAVFDDYIRYVKLENENPKITVDGGLFHINSSEKGVMQESINNTTIRHRQTAIKKSEELLNELKEYMKTARKNSDF